MAKEINKYIKFPTDRLVSGLLCINVAHEYTAARATLEADYNATDGSPVRGGVSGDTAADYSQEIGDYQSFLFYVVAAAHFNAPIDVGFSTINHRACQGFVRAHPIGLINPDTGTLLGHKLNGAAIEIRDTVSSFSQALTLQGVHNGEGSPATQTATGSGFDPLDFGSATITAGNTAPDIFHKPVTNITIESYHEFSESGSPDYKPVTHSPFQIKVNVAIASSGSTPLYNSHANIYWQPFGETADFEVGDGVFY